MKIKIGNPAETPKLRSAGYAGFASYAPDLSSPIGQIVAVFFSGQRKSFAHDLYVLLTVKTNNGQR